MNAQQLIQERDDVWKLPLPAAAKRYARRSGLKAMKRQPKQFQKVNAILTNPGRADKFKEYTVGQTTSGKSAATVPHSFNEHHPQEIVRALLDGDPC